MTRNNQKTVQPGNLKRLPPPPKKLGVVGKKKWRAIGKEMIEMKMIDRVDVHILELLCIAYDRAADAQKMLDDNGYMFMSEKGVEYPNPALHILTQAEKQIDTCMQRLGLNRKQRVDLVVKEAEIKSRVATRKR